MLVKFGPNIVDGRGSIAGVTYSRNRYGGYTRARVTPVNPSSSRQVGIRAVMAYLAEYWGESPMTDAIRLAWETYAASCTWQNKLGESVTLTGQNMFIACNAARINAGLSVVSAGPTTLGLPGQDPTLAIGSVSAGSQDASITFDDTLVWCDEDLGAMALYMGKPQKPTHNYFGGPWRYWGIIAGSVATPPTSPEAAFGSPPFTLVEGQKIFFEARIIREDGRTTTRFGCDPVIIAA